jgi:hypothetical protein
MMDVIEEDYFKDKEVQLMVDFILKFNNDKNNGLYTSPALQVMPAMWQV